MQGGEESRNWVRSKQIVSTPLHVYAVHIDSQNHVPPPDMEIYVGPSHFFFPRFPVFSRDSWGQVRALISWSPIFGSKRTILTHKITFPLQICRFMLVITIFSFRVFPGLLRSGSCFWSLGLPSFAQNGPRILKIPQGTEGKYMPF